MNFTFLFLQMIQTKLAPPQLAWHSLHSNTIWFFSALIVKHAETIWQDGMRFTLLKSDYTL